jgi:hypothetical protein
VYAEWSARGAEFLTPPKQHKTEIRCYLRDPDGHLIEVGQTTLPGGWRQFLNAWRDWARVLASGVTGAARRPGCDHESYALTWSDDAGAVIRETAALTARPSGGNLVLTEDHHRRLDQALEAGLRIVSFTWGTPAAISRLCTRPAESCCTRSALPTRQLGGLLIAQGGDRLGDQQAEYGLELPGDGLAGGGGPQQGDQLVVVAGVLPAADEVAHQQLARRLAGTERRSGTCRSIVMAAVNNPALDRK